MACQITIPQSDPAYGTNFMDGFESGYAHLWDYYDPAGISTARAHTGIYSYHFTPFNSLGLVSSDFNVSFSFYYNEFPSVTRAIFTHHELVEFGAGGRTLELRLTPSGCLVVYLLYKGGAFAEWISDPLGAHLEHKAWNMVGFSYNVISYTILGTPYIQFDYTVTKNNEVVGSATYPMLGPADALPLRYKVFNFLGGVSSMDAYLDNVWMNFGDARIPEL